MERSMIVKRRDNGERGIILTIENNLANLLLYDFTTTWCDLEELEVLGSCDSIYKCMYDMMSVQENV